MGENARKPGHPKMAESPLELLTPRPGEGYSAVEHWIWPIGGAAIGGLGMAIRNYSLKRPVWAGLPFQIIVAGIFACAFTYARDIVYADRSESEAIFRQYVALHPEDFPPFERKRFRDIYLPFSPAR